MNSNYLETFAFFVALLSLFLDIRWLREALGVEVFFINLGVLETALGFLLYI